LAKYRPNVIQGAIFDELCGLEFVEKIIGQFLEAYTSEEIVKASFRL